MDNDEFGNRMKYYESFETDRKFLPGLPIYVRLDGRGFSKFTRDMKRPYDTQMSNLMVATVKHMVSETQARFGYCQSDEISLVYLEKDHNSELFFNRKIMKMTSVLASMATAFFIMNIRNHFDYPNQYETRLPHFDARVIQLPSLEEAANMILWRTMDATKNAISMAAQSMFSHKSLQGLNGAEMQEKMFQEAGVNFNAYPAFFKQGSFIGRRIVEKALTAETLAKIPEELRERYSNPVLRSVVIEIDMPVFRKVANRANVIFNGVLPEVLVNQ
jgi:tRNA(His) guanylyltransferase